MSNDFFDGNENCIDLEEQIYKKTEETILLYECIKDLYKYLDFNIKEDDNKADNKENAKSL